MNISKVFKATFIALFAIALFSTSANAQCNSHAARKTSSHAKTTTSKDLIGLAVGSDNLSTLVAAVKAAGLVETLQEGTFTVFAPTNEAFAALPEGTVASLLKPENKDKLVQVLTYHVVPGRVESTDLRNGQAVKTVQGKDIKITANDSIIKVNDAIVKTANIRATNGVVHVIDRVILP